MISKDKEMITRSLALYQYIARYGNHCAIVKDAEGRIWKNSDNWAYGNLGRAFLAASLYMHTGEQALRDDLLKQLICIEDRSKKIASDNYTLYFGRIGLAVLYKRMFDITKHEPFLVKAAAIAREYDARRLKLRDKSSLAEGTSGFLLFCLSLYAEIKEQWLQDILYRQVELLINQARWDEKGIYWKGNGISGRCYSGLAYGGSGIALALLSTGKTFREKIFFRMADLALQFEDSYGTKANRGESQSAIVNWNEKGLIHGEVGKSLIRLYRGSLTGNKDDLVNWEATVLSLTRILDGPPGRAIPMGIADGLSGWAIALNEGYALTKNNICLDCADQIGSMLMETTRTALAISRNSENFLYGLAGIAYSLLQLQTPGASDFLILPEPARSLTEDAKAGRDLCGKGTVRLPDPGKRLLCRSMRQSVQMLEEEFPMEIRSLFEKIAVPSPGDLMWFAKGLNMRKLTGNKETVLAKIMEKEYFISTINKPLFHEDGPVNNENIFKIQRIFQLSMEEFMSLKLVVAKNLLLLDQEEAQKIDLNKAMPLEMLKHLLMVHGHTTYYFKMNKYNLLEEATLGMRKLFMHLFAKEDTVRGGLNRFTGFVQFQNKEVLEGLKATLKCNTNNQLMREVKGIFFRNVRALLINEILDCTNIEEHEVHEKYSGPCSFLGRTLF